MRSGAKLSTAGRMRVSNASMNSTPPAPGGSGALKMLPTPVSRRVAGAGIERHLVGRAVEDGRIVPDDGLGAVAVMHVPVDDRHALGAVRGLGVARRDHRVGEQAEAHGAVGFGMMAGRPDRAEGVRRLARRTPRRRQASPRRPHSPPPRSSAAKSRCRRRAGRCPRPASRRGRRRRSAGRGRSRAPHRRPAAARSASAPRTARWTKPARWHEAGPAARDAPSA